jgi:CheY-like chemotaxis protein
MSDAWSDEAILIIDDDPDLRDLVRLIAEGTNVEVVEAATCRDGIAALRANRDRVRLVSLDYFMPGMEPACCARELCSLMDSTAIVLCTAAVDPRRERPRSGSHAGCPSLSIWMPSSASCAKQRGQQPEPTASSSVESEPRNLIPRTGDLLAASV